MTNTYGNNTKFYSHLWLFLKFNLVFFILQLILIYTQKGNFVSEIHLPVKIYLELIFTLCVHITLYIFLSLLQTVLLQKIINRAWHYFSLGTWQVLIWCLFTCAILSANVYFFPISVYSKLLYPFSNKAFILIILSLSLSGILFLILNSIFYSKIWKSAALVLMGWLAIQLTLAITNSEKHPQSNPNVIILGIDSLSPESINKTSMPFLHLVLNNSVQFTNAISPTARTYPAWASMLTGLYAKHHHASENLIAKNKIDSKSSIVWLLNDLNYYTIYATDDRRFNSIGQDFGFKQVIGPKTGINEVLLGTFNDFPLSNLLINYSISAWLFPYNYMNRASFFSYYPKTFNLRLQKELSNLGPSDKPLFIAAHFTLPHWPYAWAQSLPEEVSNEFSLEKREILYQKSLKRVDQQLSAFFNFLKTHHYLDNSLVVILSDHGETLFHPGSRLTNHKNYQGIFPGVFASYIRTKTATILNKSAGHGSDILSPKQYHSLLTFNVYKDGKKITPPQKIDTRVALIDLAPTLIDFFNPPIKRKMDGISLWSSIINHKIKLPSRSFFIESGMYPNQSFSMQKIIEIGKKMYDINLHNGELEIKTSQLKAINKQKLYGVIQEQWILALYPNEKRYIAVIQNLMNGKWTDNLQDDFAQTTPAVELYAQLRKFYGTKICFPLV